uniref:Uncharacterized protein n=1 Tax=Helianthus annuus TaxID=4232 RepID=A0A251SIR7_HELAN
MMNSLARRLSLACSSVSAFHLTFSWLPVSTITDKVLTAYHMKKILKYHGVCSDHCIEDCAWLKTRIDRTENRQRVLIVTSESDARIPMIQKLHIYPGNVTCILLPDGRLGLSRARCFI